MKEDNNTTEDNQDSKAPEGGVNSQQNSDPMANNTPPAGMGPMLDSRAVKSRKWLLAGGVAVILIAAGILCWLIVNSSGSSGTLSSTQSAKTPAPAVSSSTQTYNMPAAINPVNPAAIPLGTGNVSNTPKVGYVDFCRSTTVAAEQNLPWINKANNTWDLNTKPSVQGSVSWTSQASYNVTLTGTTRTITTNDLPINHDTGTFPISPSDPAYQYDHNPNHILAQPTTWQLPANPTAAGSPSCTGDGPIGILNDGVFLFNALDAQNRDAGATEIQDNWQGHPQSSGIYHHHMVPLYLLKQDSAKSSSTLVGYALDGYGIYIERDANGNLLTNANLDQCHGRTSEVMWNGKMTDIYHYDVTLEYPYTVGCFHGTPISIPKTGVSGGSPSGNNPAPRPGAPKA